MVRQGITTSIGRPHDSSVSSVTQRLTNSSLPRLPREQGLSDHLVRHLAADDRLPALDPDLGAADGVDLQAAHPRHVRGLALLLGAARLEPDDLLAAAELGRAVGRAAGARRPAPG